MPTPTKTPARRTKAIVASKSTTGAVTTASTVKATVSCPAAPRRNVNNASVAHQTHGAVTPLNGAITNVSQLINGGRNVAKGSAGSYATLVEYGAYLRTLATHDLHRHAVEDARIVPIDDRDRLIRRLETEWTATASRYPGRGGPAIPSRKPFTREQIDAQAAVKNRLLKV